MTEDLLRYDIMLPIVIYVNRIYLIEFGAIMFRAIRFQIVFFDRIEAMSCKLRDQICHYAK